MARDKEREEQLRRRIAQVEDTAQSAACPIYGIKDRDATLVGSAFLLNVSGDMVLVTAAHVLEWKREYALHAPGDSIAVPFEGTAYRTTASGIDGKPDFKQDIAFVVLTSPAMVSGARVLRVDDLDTNDFPAHQTLYGFVGFPETQNRPKPGRRLRPSSVIYTSVPASGSVYSNLGYDQRTHFAVEFEREHLLSRNLQVATGPKPYGISGGPVWRLGNLADIEAGKAAPKVIGIGIEWHNELRVLVGVRMSLVIEAMGEAVPMYRPFLPRTEYVHATVTINEPS